ncbi:MAG: prenyltransferase/squalene oxidase repeat-containing protein, partial [Planctomycetota bacterium]
ETPLAALFLAAHDPQPRPSLRRIATYLVGAQDPRSGAWGYAPDFRDHPALTRRGWRLLATTHCCLSALNSLPGGNEAAKKRAAQYLLSCRGSDALFAYRATDRRATYPGSTAGALYALMRSGVVAPESLDPSWTALRKRFHDIDGFGEHRWFFLLFTGLAMHQRGPGAASAFHRHFRDLVVHEQDKDGSYDDPDRKGGSVLATAIAAIVLRNRFPGNAHTVPKVPAVKDRTYLAVPNTNSRVKVFEHDGRYWVDLVVSFDRPLGDRYRAAFRSALVGANRTLYDVTDGQMSIHTVDLHARKGAWDKADIRVSKEFYDRTKNPHPWAHGVTQLSTVTELSGGTKKGRRIGNWILFPPDGINWADPRIHHVLAHELCHYLFGAKDEYHQRTGESFCACIQGRRGVTELCGKDSHTDDRQEHSCWRLAKRLYPKLREPKEPDPGPWDPPGPEIGMVR